jgi:hypothetical protein
MPYTAPISQNNPTCFLFLVDTSKSMLYPLGNDPSRRKADAVAEAINKTLYALVLRCVDQSVLNRFHVGIITYGRMVNSGWGGALAGRDLVPISEVARSPVKVEQRKELVEDGRGGHVERQIRFPMWVMPGGDGKTPMNAAFERAEMLLAGFLAEHPFCFPPVVCNITDGDASDGDPEAAAQRLRRLSSEDGEVLLFNLHLSTQNMAPVEYPSSEEQLPPGNPFAPKLFRMSSYLPPVMHQPARQAKINVGPTTRGFVFNADIASVVRFLDIGTRVDARTQG